MASEIPEDPETRRRHVALGSSFLLLAVAFFFTTGPALGAAFVALGVVFLGMSGRGDGAS